MEFPFALPASRDLDAAGFGTNAVDYLIRVPHYPEYDSKLEVSSYSVDFGGEVASTMAGLSRLGMRTAYAGRFGDDEAGRGGIDSLVREGVGVEHAEVVKGALTQVGFILIDERTGERTVLWKRDDRLRYIAGEAPLDLARRARVVHLTPHDVEASIALARAANEAGTIVSADVDNMFPGIEQLLGLVDVCIMSADVCMKISDSDDLAHAVSGVAERFGAAVTGATAGLDGSIIVCNGITITTPAFAVPGGSVDTTGAGDAFRCGFLYGVLSGMSVEDAARAANAVAALKCRRPGARAGLPTVEELTDLLGSS